MGSSPKAFQLECSACSAPLTLTEVGRAAGTETCLYCGTVIALPEEALSQPARSVSKPEGTRIRVERGEGKLSFAIPAKGWGPWADPDRQSVGLVVVAVIISATGARELGAYLWIAVGLYLVILKFAPSMMLKFWSSRRITVDREKLVWESSGVAELLSLRPWTERKSIPLIELRSVAVRVHGMN